jgi:hypothetical protein
MDTKLLKLIDTMNDVEAMRIAVGVKDELDRGTGDAAFAALTPSVARNLLIKVEGIAAQCKDAADREHAGQCARTFLRTLVELEVFNPLIAEQLVEAGVRLTGGDIVGWFKGSFNLSSLLGIAIEYEHETVTVENTPTGSIQNRRTIRGGQTRMQKPRWILANVFDLSAADRKKPTPAFRAGAPHEIRVIIGAEQDDWLVARGRDTSESIDSMLPTGTHELTVVFFIPALSIHQTGKLTLPSSGPSPEPATFRFEVGAAGSAIEALISIVHRGRVLQTALLAGKAVANPLRAPAAARIALRLQVVVPGFDDLDRREVFDAALVTATGAADAAVAAGVVHSAAGPGKTVLFDQPRIDRAARAIRTVLEEVVTDDSTKGKLDSEAARTLLWKLAQDGRILYEHIGERLEKELSGHDLSRLQLVQADSSAFIPIEFTYGLPPPANGAALCKNWKGALAGKLCTARHHRTNALGHLEVVCPSGFWGMNKVIERQRFGDLTNEEMRKSDFGVRAEPSAKRPNLPPIGSALFAWSDILDNTVPGTSAGVLKSLDQATRKHAVAVKTWPEWARAIDEHQPGLLVLLSHTVDDALEIGPEKSGEIATLAHINPKFVRKLDQDAPIVILLGCTTGVADDTLVSFVGRFRNQGAALVVGTITPVLGERSAAVVKAVVAKLAQKRAQPVRFGELMRDVRRDLLSLGELTALCATSFGDASWLVS